MEKVKRIQELRRSNAATAIPKKKKYSRKNKYKNKFEAFIYACIRRHNAELFFPYHHESTGVKWDGNYEFWD